MLTRERAQEIFERAKMRGGWNWIEYISPQLTNEEMQYVHNTWDKMSGNSSFWDAFNKIRMGNHVGK